MKNSKQENQKNTDPKNKINEEYKEQAKEAVKQFRDPISANTHRLGEMMKITAEEFDVSMETAFGMVTHSFNVVMSSNNMMHMENIVNRTLAALGHGLQPYPQSREDGIPLADLQEQQGVFYFRIPIVIHKESKRLIESQYENEFKQLLDYFALSHTSHILYKEPIREGTALAELKQKVLEYLERRETVIREAIDLKKLHQTIKEKKIE